MIIDFSVQNFGSIKEKQTLSFEADKSTHLENYYVAEPIKGLRLLKLALIYGANASGKTTILKALDFLRDIVLKPEEKKTAQLNFNPFLFDEHTPHQNTILSTNFIQLNTRYYYEVELNKKAIVREELYFYNPNKANVFRRTTNLDNQFTEIVFGSKIKIDSVAKKTLESNTLWNNTVFGGFIKTNVQLKELRDVIDWFFNCLRSLILPRTTLKHYVTKRIENSEIKRETIIAVLKKADFNVSGISIKKEEIDFSELMISPPMDVELEHNIGKEKHFLPFEDESLGTQRYYGFAGILALLIKKSMVISIDELESSLHPDLYVHFLLSFLVNAKQSQLIATTHNREILSNKDIFRNDAIWITDKSETCATELYSLADFDSSVIRDTSNIYNAFKIGKLGGVPHLGDYYIDIDDEKE